MKRFFVLFLLLSCVFVFVGCKKEDANPKDLVISGETTLAVDQQITLTVQDGYKPTWTSSDESVATVKAAKSFEGFAYVVGVKPGTVTIKADYEEGFVETEITVTEPKEVGLNLAVTYQGKEYISYKQSEPYEAPNGIVYNTGDLLAGFVEYGKFVDAKFTDVTPTGGKKEADILKEAAIEGFVSADIYNGKVVDLNMYGQEGKFVALDEYLDKMPNLKAFLAKNEALKLSLEASDGHMYYAPYFDGMDEVERGFYLRHDWVEKLLDTTPNYDTEKIMDTVYTPFYKDGIDTVVKGTTKDINKKYTGAENIIAIQNNLAVKNGKNLTEALVKHIKDRYGNQYAKPSELFLSENAAYDADELVALMRCVKANPLLLTGDAATDIAVFMPRDTGASRTTMITTLASIWGVRGTNGDNTLYIDKDGKLVDGAVEEDNFEAYILMNKLYQEGLILENYDTKAGEVTDWRGVYMYTNGTGFMTLDYNQSTTANYDSKKVASSTKPAVQGLKIRTVLPPVADWDDGVDGNFIHFSEFSRAIKTEGWGISANVLKNEEKLAAALRVIDFPYSDQGEILVTWGPSDWIDGTIEYVGPNGVEVIPRISDRARKEINDLTGGNLTNYYRRYVGSTFAIGHVRHMGFEYQILNEDGLASVELINKAIDSGAMDITLSTYNPEKGYFFLTPPSTWSLTKTENDRNSSEAPNATKIYADNKHNFIMVGSGNKTANNDLVPTYAMYKEMLTEAHYYDVYFANYNAAWNRMKLKYLEK